jgi:hypothetical protein
MKAVFALFFIICMAQSAWCQERPVQGHELPFKVEISIHEASLKTDLYREWGEFFVDTKVENISNEDQNIIVWTQQGWSWISDNFGVVPGTEAANNSASKINLRPGQEYAGAVEIFFDPHKTKPVTFRLGFFPRAELPISGQPGFASLHSNEIVWSNPVTLTE